MKTFQASLHVPLETAAVASARRFTESCLARWHLEDLVDTMNLLVTEVVTNAVVHGGTAADLRLLLSSRRLRAEVRDGSQSSPKVKNFSATATTGRGMQIVASLSDRWGADAEPDGKVVWFELDLSDRKGNGTVHDRAAHDGPGPVQPLARQSQPEAVESASSGPEQHQARIPVAV